MKRFSIAEALRVGIAEELERDERVFCMGEDIGIPGGWGGAFTVTLGLEKKFPDRILDTPIAENGFFGAAVGAAMLGMRPIVDVQYGTYVTTAVIEITNGITIQGFNGAANTVVKGTRNSPYHRGFYVAHGDAVLDGLTITNCAWFYDAVINSTNSGGGIYMEAGTVQNCVLAGNWCQAHGGAIYMVTGLVENCTIGPANRGDYSGGGVYLAGGGTVRNCLITNNSCGGGSGGGVRIKSGLVENCIITHNSSGLYGGGVHWYYGVGPVRNCLIVNNSAASAGGGVAGYGGGGLSVESSTICSNSVTAWDGGGVMVIGGSFLTVKNCIVYFNTKAGATNNWGRDGGSAGFITYSCTTPTNELTGAGLIESDPLLVVNRSGGYYRLEGGSPCIDAGTYQSWMTNATDLDGNPRIIRGIVDIGAYEWASPRGTVIQVR